MVSSLAILSLIVAVMALALLRTNNVITGAGVNSIFGSVEIDRHPAPDFTIQLMDEQELTLSDLHGDVILIDFWSSWCAPCRKEAANLNLLYSEYQSKGVQFIGISIWDRADDVENIKMWKPCQLPDVENFQIGDAWNTL